MLTFADILWQMLSVGGLTSIEWEKSHPSDGELLSEGVMGLGDTKADT